MKQLSLLVVTLGCALLTACGGDDPKVCAAATANARHMLSPRYESTATASDLKLDGAHMFEESANIDGGLEEYLPVNDDLGLFFQIFIGEKRSFVEIIFNKENGTVRKIELSYDIDHSYESYICIEEDCQGTTVDIDNQSMTLNNAILQEEGGDLQETISGNFTWTFSDPNEYYDPC